VLFGVSGSPIFTGITCSGTKGLSSSSRPVNNHLSSPEALFIHPDHASITDQSLMRQLPFIINVNLSSSTATSKLKVWLLFSPLLALDLLAHPPHQISHVVFQFLPSPELHLYPFLWFLH
jgi:hypothetical protein